MTDSGLSESSESAVTLTTDNLQQHASASNATTPVSQAAPGLGIIGSNNYGTTGAAVGFSGNVVSTANLMEIGHSRNSSNTSQVSGGSGPVVSRLWDDQHGSHFSRFRCQKVRATAVSPTVNIRGRVPRATRGMQGTCPRSALEVICFPCPYL